MGYTCFTPGGFHVVYVPGDGERTVTENAAKRVTREYECQNPRAGTLYRSRNVRMTDFGHHGIRAVLLTLAAGLTMNGLGALAWWLL